MHDLKERLERLAEEGTPRGATDVMHAARRSLDGAASLGSPLVPQRSSRRPMVLAFVVVLLVALVVSAVLVFGGSDEKSRLVPVVPTPNGLSDLFDTAHAPGRPQYLVPGFVPDGMRPLRISGGYPPPAAVAPGFGRSQLWVKLDAAGDRPIETFTVGWGPGATAYDELNKAIPSLDLEPTDDPLAYNRSGTVPAEVRGRDGLYSEKSRSLAWEEPKGQMVSIYGESLSRADLVGIADALQPRRDGGFTVTQAPPEFVQVSEGADSGGGSNVREVFYRGAADRGFGVRVVDDPGSPPGANLSLAAASDGDPRVVELRGHHAVLTKMLVSGGGGLDQQTLFLEHADRYVQWLEPGNVMVTVSAVGLSQDEVLAIARGLRAVDAADWDELLVQAPGRSSGIPPVSPTGEPPTFTGEQAAVAEAFHAWLDARNARNADAAAAVIEDGDRLRETFAAVQAGSASLGVLTSRVDAVRLVGTDRALVNFSILANGASKLPDQQGAAVRVNGRWLVSRATYCAIVALVGVTCPAQ